MHSTKMLGARLIQVLSNIIGGILIPKLVSPERYGLFRSLLLITQYGNYSNMGTYQTMDKEMPYLAGKGEWGIRTKICNNTFYFSVFSSLFVGIGLILASLFIKGEFSDFYRHGFRIFAFVVVTANILDFYYHLLRVEKKFALFSMVTIITNIINTVLAVGLLLSLHNVIAVAYAMVVSNSVAITIAVKNNGWPKFYLIQIIEMWRQICVGFPILLSGITAEIMRTADQIMIVMFLKPVEMGLYGVAISIQRVITLFPGVLGSIFTPYLFEEFGRNDSAIKSSRLFEKSMLIISLFSAFTVCGAYLFVHILIIYFLPGYRLGLNALYILLFSAFSMSLLGLPDNFIIVNGKVKSSLMWQLTTIVVSITTIYAVIKIGYGIKGIAAAVSFNFILYSIGNLFIAYNMYIANRAQVFKKIAKLYFPFLYLFFSLVVITQLVANTAQTFASDFLISCLRAVIFLMTAIPMIIFYDRKLKILATVGYSLKKNRRL